MLQVSESKKMIDYIKKNSFFYSGADFCLHSDEDIERIYDKVKRDKEKTKQNKTDSFKHPRVRKNNVV